jgi:peptidoglycan/LPS O-acetylase OafA/YrhL
MDPDSRRPLLPALTSVRFLAAAWVAVFHAQAMKIFVGPAWFQSLSSIGYLGVNFFFVLSGFILVYTYSGRTISRRRFWQARFARIYPALAFSLLLMTPSFFYVCLKMDVARVVPEWVWPAAHLKLSALLTVLMLQTWIPQNSMAWHMPTWSLSNEAFFYLLFPFLLPVFGRLSRKSLLAVLPAGFFFGVAISAIYGWLQPDGAIALNSHVIATWRYFISFNPLLRLPEFLMGMACGVLYLRSGRDRRRAWPLILAGSAMVVVMAVILHRNPNTVFHAALLGPAFAAIIFGAALQPAGLAVLGKRFFVLLGDASYSFYLLHPMVIAAYTRFFQDRAGNLRHQNLPGIVLLLATISAVAILSYKLIETPLRRVLGPKRDEKLMATVLRREVDLERPLPT